MLGSRFIGDVVLQSGVVYAKIYWIPFLYQAVLTTVNTF